MRIPLRFARWLERMGARLRRRCTSEMSTAEYLQQFGEVMTAADHGRSWGTANYGNAGGIVFTFVTMRAHEAKTAMRVLGEAGLLCETPLLHSGTPPVTEAGAVFALTVGLRRLGGGG